MLRLSWEPGRKFKKALEMGVSKGGSLRLGLGLQLPLNWTMNSNYTIKPNRNLWVIRVYLGRWVLIEESG